MPPLEHTFNPSSTRLAPTRINLTHDNACLIPEESRKNDVPDESGVAKWLSKMPFACESVHGQSNSEGAKGVGEILGIEGRVPSRSPYPMQLDIENASQESQEYILLPSPKMEYPPFNEATGTMSNPSPEIDETFVDSPTPHVPGDETYLSSDGIYKSLLEAMLNDVSRIIGAASLAKLKTPVEDHLNCCIERMLNDISPVTLSEDHCEMDQTGNVSSFISCSPGHAPESSNETGSLRNHKRKTLHEQTDTHHKTRSDDLEDAKDESNLNAYVKTAKVSRTSENVYLSCPFRKRNPKRFNIRDRKRTCATTSFSTLSLLKYEVPVSFTYSHTRQTNIW